MKIAWLICLSISACGGRAVIDTPASNSAPAHPEVGAIMLDAGVAGSVDRGTPDAGQSSVGATDDAGSPHCTFPAPVACTYMPSDRSDLPADQRWGTLGTSQYSAINDCIESGVCGDVFIAVDRAGCVDPNANATSNAFAACVIRDLTPFKWPCAAGQQVRFVIPCGPK